MGVDELNEQYTEESIDLAADFFIEEGINEEGVDLIIEEVGVDAFTEFVFNCNTSLLDEAVRDMKKAPKRDYAKVKASVDKKDAERKAKGTGEYAKTKTAKDKYGDEDNTNYDDDTPKKKVVATVKKVKAKQPEKKPEKKGIVGKIRGAVAKGMERHKAATKAASKSLKDTAKQHSQHRKDFVKGATPTAKEKKIAGGIAKGVKKAVTGEEVEHIDELKTSTLRNYANKAAIDAVGRGVDAGIKGMTGTKDEMEKNMTKAYKRQRGISRAVNKLAGRAQKAEKKEEFDPSVQEDLHPNIKKIDAMSKANVAKQAAKSAAEKSARDKTAAAFQAHKKATLAKGGRPVDALDSWNKKKLNKEAVDPKGGGANPDLSVKQQNTERQQTASQREKIRKQRELIARMRQQDVAQGRQPTGHTAREEVEIDERLGGKGYSKKAAASSVYPGKKSTGDWPDSDRGEGNKAARRAGKPVKAKSPTYIAHVKNKKANEALDLKKDDAGSAPADKKAEGMNKQIERKEKKVAVMKRQILQKKVQAVRAGAGGDVVAHFEPEGEVVSEGPSDKSVERDKRDWKGPGAPGLDAHKERLRKHKEKRGKKKDDTYDEPNWEKRKANNEKARKDLMKGPQMKNPHLEAYRVLAKSGSDKGKPSQFSYKDEKDAKKFADSIKKDGGRATVSKEETVVELNRYEKETGKSSGSLNMPKGKPTKKGGDESPVMRAVRSSMRRETGRPEGQQKKAKGAKSDAGTGKYLAKQKAKKDYADKAKKAGFKSTQAYTDTVARYGGESNYKAGRGLGT